MSTDGTDVSTDRNVSSSEMSSARSTHLKLSVLLGYEATSLDNWSQTFRNNRVVSS